MQVKELFAKQIDRPINGVIKADQADSESIWQELDEYVITKELDIHFRRFFGAYLDALDHPNDPNITGKIGVWISGFFGSGKSHFLKILSYLMDNRVVQRDGQTKRAIEFFDGKIQDAMLAADIKRAVSADAGVDVILFNIDSKADSSGGRDAILRDFGDGFSTKGASWLIGLYQNRFHPGHLVGAINVVGAELVVDEVACLVVGHFLAVTVTQRLYHAAFHLPAGGQRIDGHTRIHSHDQLRHCHLPSFRIYFNLSKLPGKRRR